MIKSVIFDMDGTLVDSEPIWKKSDEAWLESKGVQLPAEQWHGFLGKGGNSFIRELLDTGLLNGDPVELRNEKDSFYLDFSQTRLKVFPEIFLALEHFCFRGLKTALASASSEQVIDLTLTRTGVKDFFYFTCSGDLLEKNKPDPMLFLHVARQLGTPVEETLVIEDSQYGVQAALRAGMRLVAVPHQIPNDLQTLFNQADFLALMDYFKAEDLFDWLKEKRLLPV